MRASGLVVMVGEVSGADGWKIAQKDGFGVYTASEAAKRGAMVLLLIQDEDHKRVYENETAQFVTIDRDKQRKRDCEGKYHDMVNVPVIIRALIKAFPQSTDTCAGSFQVYHSRPNLGYSPALALRCMVRQPRQRVRFRPRIVVPT